MKFLIRWLVSTLAIIIAAYLIPAVSVDTLFAAFVAALVLGLINTILKPILVILTLPINIMSLGLFTLVINAGLVLLTDMIVPGFEITGFWWAMLFSVVLSLLTFTLNKLSEPAV